MQYLLVQLKSVAWITMDKIPLSLHNYAPVLRKLQDESLNEIKYFFTANLKCTWASN